MIAARRIAQQGKNIDNGNNITIEIVPVPGIRQRRCRVSTSLVIGGPEFANEYLGHWHLVYVETRGYTRYRPEIRQRVYRRRRSKRKATVETLLSE